MHEDDYFLACHHDFPTFIGFVFSTLFPSKPYLHNWHIDAMAEQLVQSYEGKCQRLIVNMPPRMLKSIVMSVAYPAWVLGRDPSTEVMCISYGDELVKDLGNKCLMLMQSARYQKVFPGVRLHKRHQNANHIGVIGGGKRLGIPAGGAITGRGGDIIIIDDPLKASDARTAMREVINQWYDDNIYQRINHKNTGVVIVVMQRLHEHDLTGHLLEKPEPWTWMKLPAIAEHDEDYVLPEGGVHHRKAGDVLHPQLESLEKLEIVKANQGTYVFASQYQQEPACDSEALVSKSWFVIESTTMWPEKYERIIQSWDTAHKVEESNDFSVGITIGQKDKHYYILDVIRKRMKFPELMATMRKTKSESRNIELLVEDAASGQTIIQALRGEGIPVKQHAPVGDKFTRLSGVSGIIESGLVHLPASASWLDDFLLEVTRFPGAKHDDQVDALSQGLNYLSTNIPREPRIWIA